MTKPLRALVLVPVFSLAIHQSDQLQLSQSEPRGELTTSEQTCEPQPGFQCVWEDSSAPLDGTVLRGNTAVRTISLREEDGSIDGLLVASAIATPAQPSFTFQVPIERHGHVRCMEGHVQLAMKSYPRRLWVESPGCRSVNIICRDSCEPGVVELSCR